ncbi:HET domain-containing protein, partial [Candidatus Bathyarchaeota archaeon]|nr:HET domain-containing protein [Candidatus Bathyarchaeota archaeon]
FRYLWVDALCIIQNDPADKDREISGMATIYKNAAVTLAASVADKASNGFLNRKSTPYLPPYAFTIPMSDDQTGTVYLAAGSYETDHPLDKRGWALQEFMLSSRLLIFSDHETLWQCKEVPLRSVTGASPLSYRQRLESLPWAAFEDDAEPRFGTLDLDKIYLWKTIVRQYTDRHLTDAEDRLRAVSGVVSELEKVWRDASIYGHWKAWFVPLLAWYKPDVDKVGERHLGRAPSWSWVSVDGGIRFEDSLDVEDARVKTLTVARVVLSCRVLRYDNIDEDKVNSVSERPDLRDSAVMRELGDGECDYLLLGSTRVDDREIGVGLLVLQVARQQCRRVGLALFADMAIWEGVKLQDVTLEPKAQR